MKLKRMTKVIMGMTKWKPFQKKLPLTEFLEDNSVGEALSADTDAFKDTIAPELFQDQGRINLSTLKRTMGRKYCWIDHMGFVTNSKQKQWRKSSDDIKGQSRWLIYWQWHLPKSHLKHQLNLQISPYFLFQVSFMIHNINIAHHKHNTRYLSWIYNPVTKALSHDLRDPYMS